MESNQGLPYRSLSTTSPRPQAQDKERSYLGLTLSDAPDDLPPPRLVSADKRARGSTSATNFSAPPTPLIPSVEADISELRRNISDEGEAMYSHVPGRTSYYTKPLPDVHQDLGSPALHEIPLSPPPVSQDFRPDKPDDRPPPARKGFSFMLPKFPRMRTAEYLKSITMPTTFKFNFNPSGTKSQAAAPSPAPSAAASETSSSRPNLPSLKVDPPDDNSCNRSAATTCSDKLISPLASGFLYPHREDYFSYRPHSGRPSADPRAKSAPDVRQRMRNHLGPYQTPRAPPSLLRSTTTPNLTSKFPVPRKVSYAARTRVERANANVEVGNTFLSNPVYASWGVEGVGRWTGFKWVLLVSVFTVFLYGLGGLVCVLGVWFQAWPQAIVLATTDPDILILITLASILLIVTSLVGLTGTLLNSRPILAFYALFLWPSFVSMLTVGYISYRRSAFALDRKLNEKWSQDFDAGARLVIQAALRCCGYYNPLHETTLSRKCYPRTQLPGCKLKLYIYEKSTLSIIYTSLFSLAPVHILNIFVSILCANHVNRTFGKGLTPKQYRLTAVDVAAESEVIQAILLEKVGSKREQNIYGSDVNSP